MALCQGHSLASAGFGSATGAMQPCLSFPFWPAAQCLGLVDLLTREHVETGEIPWHAAGMELWHQDQSGLMERPAIPTYN